MTRLPQTQCGAQELMPGHGLDTPCPNACGTVGRILMGWAECRRVMRTGLGPPGVPVAWLEPLHYLTDEDNKSRL